LKYMGGALIASQQRCSRQKTSKAFKSLFLSFSPKRQKHG